MVDEPSNQTKPRDRTPNLRKERKNESKKKASEHERKKNVSITTEMNCQIFKSSVDLCLQRCVAHNKFDRTPKSKLKG